ncbi:hypothetical protein NPIL_49411 [Nephila pilipes]|uniref:Uncharacterized protein n=1 Tax=Nephila pilipes TaxID=299642 RepID=A0A8X6TWX9_NEPPI|nr:hypothetical protein NPIL_49411 [Nephila pilipes]
MCSPHTFIVPSFLCAPVWKYQGATPRKQRIKIAARVRVIMAIHRPRPHITVMVVAEEECLGSWVRRMGCPLIGRGRGLFRSLSHNPSSRPCLTISLSFHLKPLLGHFPLEYAAVGVCCGHGAQAGGKQSHWSHGVKSRCLC